MKKIFLSLVMSVCCLFANAQSVDEYVSYPYGFIGIQGGAQTLILGKNSGDMKFTPSAAFSVGSMFNPYIGLRLDFQGAWDKASMKGGNTSNFNSITADLDLLVNLTNCFRDEKYTPLNLYFIGGAGAIAPFNCDEEFLKDDYNFRAGLLLDYRLSRITSLNLEVNGNYLTGGKSDLYGNHKIKVNALLGLAFRLPFSDETESVAKNGNVKNVDAPTTSVSDAELEAARAEAARAEAARAAEAKARAEAARKAAEAKAKAQAEATAKAQAVKPINETIFFKLGKTTTADKFNEVVEQTAAWCKQYPNKTVTIDAYADKGTGTAKQNVITAERRAKAVADAIKAKGVAADQLKVTSHGDKVQPFAENDQNRCVIIVGE